MILWIDAQLSPALATWISEEFSIPAVPLRDVGLRDATDREIFLAAKREGAVVITKDGDFSKLLASLGPPPQVIWIRCGNTSNAYLKKVLLRNLPKAIELLQSGEELIEIR